MSQRVCVIVGFCYDGLESGRLVSSSIDMFTAFRFFSDRGFMCKVLSDLTTHPRPVFESIFAGVVEDNIYSFLPHLPRGREPLDTLEWFIVKDITQLTDTLTDIDVSQVSKLAIYYTGHSERGGMMVVPDDNLMRSSYLRERLLKKCNKSVEVVTIFDTCFVGDGGLPFVFDTDRFILKDIDRCVTHSVVHFSSSREDEVSSSDLTRSIFTMNFFSYLSDGVIHVGKLLEKVQEGMNKATRKRQTALCSSSFDRSPVLYSWLLPSGIEVVTRG